MLGSNSPEALFKAADSLVDYKASKLRLKASMSGVGIFCANVGRFAAVWLPKSADPKKDAVMAMSRWDTELGGLGLGGHITGDPSLHSVRPKRPRSREDRDLPAIQLPSTKWVPMLVTASAGSNHSNSNWGLLRFMDRWSHYQMAQATCLTCWAECGECQHQIWGKIHMQLSEKTSSPRNMALRQRSFRWSIGKISDSLAKFFFWGCGMELW